MGDSTVKAVVIGGGVIGLCSAHALLEKGFEVTLLEKRAEDYENCSFGNGGMIVPSHFVPLASPGTLKLGLSLLFSREGPFGFMWPPTLETAAWIGRFMASANAAHVEKAAPVLCNLNLASRAEYHRLADLLGPEIGHGERGLVMLCKTPDTLEEESEMVEAANRVGLHARAMDPSDLSELDPSIQTTALGGVYFQEDAHVSPAQFMRAMRKRVESLGAHVRYGVDTRFSRGEVIANGEAIPADVTVLAAGAWSGEIAKDLGLKIPLLSGRGYGFTVPNPPQAPQIPTILTEARIAVTPMVDGLRFVGTMELGAPREEVNPNRLNGLRKSIGDYYPAFKNHNYEAYPVWTGLRPCSPDGLPYLGRTSAASSVIVATGHAMMGMSLGPITGQLVAQIACGEPTSVSIDALSPDRYA